MKPISGKLVAIEDKVRGIPLFVKIIGVTTLAFLLISVITILFFGQAFGLFIVGWWLHEQMPDSSVLGGSLATGALYLTLLVPFWLAFHDAFSWSGKRRRRGWLLVSLWTILVLCGLAYLQTKIFFLPDGKPLKEYTFDQGNIVHFHDKHVMDQDGNWSKPVTPEFMQKYRRSQQGGAKLTALPENQFFDPFTGKAVKWYSKNPVTGRYEIFPYDGTNRMTGQKLQEVTPEIMKEILEQSAPAAPPTSVVVPKPTPQPPKEVSKPQQPIREKYPGNFAKKVTDFDLRWGEYNQFEDESTKRLYREVIPSVAADGTPNSTAFYRSTFGFSTDNFRETYRTFDIYVRYYPELTNSVLRVDLSEGNEKNLQPGYTVEVHGNGSVAVFRADIVTRAGSGCDGPHPEIQMTRVAGGSETCNVRQWNTILITREDRGRIRVAINKFWAVDMYDARYNNFQGVWLIMTPGKQNNGMCALDKIDILGIGAWS